MATSKLPADDLFESSSMSFGEHLEELRRCLAKALVWLAAGTIIGLLFANQIVKFIETPLKQAIKDFHIEQAKEQFLAANSVEAPEKLKNWLQSEGMMPSRVYMDPRSLDVASDEDVDSLSAEDDGSQAVEPAKQNTSGEEDAKDKASKSSDGKSSDGKSSEDQKRPRVKAADSSQTKGNDTKLGETELDEAELDESEFELQAPSFEENPWTGVTIKDLARLRPTIIWTPIENKLISLNPVEGFMIWLKAGLVAGVVIGSPGIFWHIWHFLASGLYPHERRYVYWYLPLSLTLFLSGVSLAFFVVFRLVLGFLMHYSTGLDVEFTPRLSDYMSFALFLPLGFGIAFQLPIVMLGLHRFGLVTVDAFRAQWRIAVLTIAFLSMMLTPADIYSMLGLFVPLVLLYFFGIFLCKYMPQGAGVGGPALDPQG